MHARSNKRGMTQRSAVAEILAELTAPVDLQAFRSHVGKLLQRVKEEKEASMVPAGREADHPHLVFQEQLMNALA